VLLLEQQLNRYMISPRIIQDYRLIGKYSECNDMS